MVTAHRVIKNTGYLYLRVFFNMFISLYTTRLIINELGVSDFGVFNVVGGAIGMLGFINIAMVGSTQRFLSYAEGEGNIEKQIFVFNSSVIIHFIIALISVCGLIILGVFLFNGILNIPNDRIYAAKVVYISMIISTAFTMMSVPYDAEINAHENMKYYAIIGIIESILKLGIAISLAYISFDKLIYYGILMGLIPFMRIIVLRIYCHKRYVECVVSPRKYFDKIMIKDMLSFAGWNFFTSSADLISYNGIGILINMFFGVLSNTANSLAFQLLGLLSVFTNYMIMAIKPILVKSEATNQRDKMMTMSVLSTKLLNITLCLILIPAIVEMPFLLRVWLKKIPDYAVIFCRLVLIRELIHGFIPLFQTNIQAVGKIKQFSIVDSISMILFVVVAYLGYKLGAVVEYIYYVLIILAIVRVLITLYFTSKECGLNISKYLNYILKSSISTLILFVIFYFITVLIESEVLELMVITLSTLIIMPTISLLLFFNNYEKQYCLNIYYDIKKKILNKI